MHKKLRILISITAIVLLVLLGIFMFHSRKTDKNLPDSLVRDFLTEFFTWNKDNRLDTFSADNPDIYYAPFQQYLTEDALKKIAADRLPYKYDITVPAGTDAEVTELSYTFDESGTHCQFDISIQIRSSQKTLNQTATGQLSLTGASADALIDNIHITGITSLN